MSQKYNATTTRGIKEAEDNKWMKVALKLAKRGEGKVSPNPMVGAVLVKEGDLIAQGYYRYFGGPHAEVEAIEKAKNKAREATLYVSLEPCNRYGKTPPCTQKIIQAGIKRVVVATLDPTSGGGIKQLEKEGIETQIGVCEKEAKQVNEAFLKYIKRRIPFVTVKAASSLDGKIATHKGESKWITSEEARKFAHSLRNRMDAVLVGINTIIRDNSSLLPPSHKKNFARIVLDSKLRIPLEARVLSDQDKADTFIFTTSKADKQKLKRLEDKGIKVAIMEEEEGKVNLTQVLEKLGKLEIMSLLVEGGGEVIASFFEKKSVDKIFLFLAPRIIGGRDAKTWVEGKGVDLLKETSYLDINSVRKIGKDLLLEGYPRQTPEARTDTFTISEN